MPDPQMPDTGLGWYVDVPADLDLPPHLRQPHDVASLLTAGPSAPSEPTPAEVP